MTLLKILSSRTSDIINKKISINYTRKLAKNLPLVTLPVIACLKENVITDSYAGELVDKLELTTKDIDFTPFEATQEATDIIDSVTGATDVAEVGIGVSIPGLGFAVKSIKPLSDLAKGKKESAKARLAVRATESVFCLPAKMAWGVASGLKGIVTSFKGGRDKDSGFINGYNKGMKSWVAVRNEIEELFIPDEELPMKKDEDWIHFEHRCRVKDTIEKNIAEINKIIGGYRTEEQNAMLASLKQHAQVSKSMEAFVGSEKERREILRSQIGNLKINRNVDVELLNKNLLSLEAGKKNLERLYQEEINELMRSMHSIRKKEIFSQGIYEKYRIEYEKLESESKKIQNVINVYNKINIKNNAFGMAKIAGYEDLKVNLRENYLKQIQNKANGLSANLPNMILFYGPKGCGKTLMSKALGEEANCNIVELRATLDFEEDLKNLKEKIRAAGENYNKNGTHTIIKIEECDSFLVKGNIPLEVLEELNRLAQDKNCTIIATSNYPQNINSGFMQMDKLEKIYVKPASKENIQKVLKYYMEDFSDSTVNYEVLADEIMKKTTDYTYSNSKLANSMLSKVKKEYVEKGKFSQKDLIQYVETSIPDIKKETLEIYEESRS